MSEKKSFMSYERPSVTADVVLFRIKNEFVDKRQKNSKKLQVLLLKREEEPCKNQWSLPGGFVGISETIEEVAKRKVLEKTGYDNFYMEQLYTFDAIDRDERWRVISTSYIGIVKSNFEKIQSGLYETKWFDFVDGKLFDEISGEELKMTELAFDHANIINTAISRIRGKLFYSNIGFEFESEEFTVGSLQGTFETILQRKIDNFKRTMQSRIEETGGVEDGMAYRPAKLYKIKKEF